jgi:hypothetical protein
VRRPTDRFDTRLRESEAEVDFLPELVELWAEESPVARATWYLEWWELMSRLEALEGAYRGEVMTPEQRYGYRILRRKLRDALPLLERLDLPLPTTPLDDNRPVPLDK